MTNGPNDYSETATPRPSRASGNAAVRVVVADDYALIRAGLRAVLEGSEVAIVGEASTGAEAVDLVRALKPDLVFMDIVMPGMDGLEATRIIKGEAPATCVLMLSSAENPEYLRDALAAGASGYVLKDMDPKALIAAVQIVRNGESLIDTRLLGRLLAGMERAPAPQGGGSLSPVEGSGPGLEELSPLERQVLKLITEGFTNGEIARDLHYSVGTIKNAVQRIIEKMGVSDRTQAAVYAVRAGVTP